MSDWSPPISLSFIPTGQLVTFTAMHQAAYTQSVQIIDSNKHPISFQTLSGGSASFPISGIGTTIGFFENGAGKFTMQAGYQVQFMSSGSAVPLVAVSNPSSFFINNQIYGGGVLMVTEDGGGTDYNDTSFVLEWYSQMG